MSLIPSPGAAGAAVKAPFTWAKARPFIFGLLILLVVIAAIRWRTRIVSFLTGLAFVGRPFAAAFGVPKAQSA